jgi:hypothetical protein
VLPAGRLDGGTGAVLGPGLELVRAGPDDAVVRCGTGRLAGAAELLGPGWIGGCAGRGVWLT